MSEPVLTPQQHNPSQSTADPAVPYLSTPATAQGVSERIVAAAGQVGTVALKAIADTAPMPRTDTAVMQLGKTVLDGALVIANDARASRL